MARVFLRRATVPPLARRAAAGMRAARRLLPLLLLACAPGTADGWAKQLIRPRAFARGRAPPPHPTAAIRPLILFNDTFFGRDFVPRDYAFEARAL